MEILCRIETRREADREYVDESAAKRLAVDARQLPPRSRTVSKTDRVGVLYAELCAGESGAYGRLLAELMPDTARVVDACVLASPRLGVYREQMLAAAYKKLVGLIAACRLGVRSLANPRESIVQALREAVATEIAAACAP